MAIAQMTKIMIVTHRSEAVELLEVLQEEGIVQVLDAEKAMVSKEWPELQVDVKRPKDLEDMVLRLDRAIVFLKDYAGKGAAVSALSPRVVVGRREYAKVVGGKEALDLLEETDTVEAQIERLGTECENVNGRLEGLLPWRHLETPVEEIHQLKTAVCFTGLLPHQYFSDVGARLTELAAAIEQVGATGNMHACVVGCLKDSAGEVQKVLRGGSFEVVNFEGMSGVVAGMIAECREKLADLRKQLEEARTKAAKLAGKRVSLQILFDHYQNVLNREITRARAPASESVVLLEGWVKKKDFKRLEKLVGGFNASSVEKIEPAEDETIPVEIENNTAIRPFEVVTRLYGMPQHFDVDPTIFLAPFFALFFGLCLTDAGYGLVLMVATACFIRKMQGDKKLMWMLMVCGGATVVAGALTGGWFGDAVQQFVPKLGIVRERMMWFDPLENPMMFFGLSLVLGYVQIISGLTIAFVHNLREKDYIAAACDQLTWLVMLNALVVFGVSTTVPSMAGVGSFCGKLAILPAVTIVLFSQREGPIAGRLGMGAYQLFSAIFYMGDVLSYLRLMALGMVTAGLAMAVNVIAGIVTDIPFGLGYLLAALIFVGGHAFNLVLSGLSAFVHTLRLQYVEFFPKFLMGGGKIFEPLTKEYKHVYLSE